MLRKRNRKSSFGERYIQCNTCTLNTPPKQNKHDDFNHSSLGCLTLFAIEGVLWTSFQSVKTTSSALRKEKNRPASIFFQPSDDTFASVLNMPTVHLHHHAGEQHHCKVQEEKLNSSIHTRNNESIINPYYLSQTKLECHPFVVMYHCNLIDKLMMVPLYWWWMNVFEVNLWTKRVSLAFLFLRWLSVECTVELEA